MQKRGKSAPQYTLFLMGEPIEKVSSFKYLGVTISDDLTWSKHIQTISSKARRIIGMLYRQFYRYKEVLPHSCIYIKHKLDHIWSIPVYSLGPIPGQGHTTPGGGPEICD